MRKALVSPWIVLTTLTNGCMAAGMAGHAAHTAPPAQSAEAQAGGMGAMPMEACPMSVPGTQVAAADTPEGESVTFTTSPDRAADLRARVHEMADWHNRQQQGGGMEGTHGGMMGGGMMGGGSMGSSSAGAGRMSMMPPPSRAMVEDVGGGARIVVTPITPNDLADLDRLRSTMRMRAEQMQRSGTCSMGPPAR